MKLGIHETMELHEALSDAVCMIDHFSLYISLCEDHELRNILERQHRFMIENYQRNINALQGRGVEQARIPQIRHFTRPATGTQYGTQQTSPTAPHPEARSLDDKAIASGALLLHKCGAIRATSAALECADPNLRNLLSNSARSCMEMAYEIFRYMNQRGWYQVPEAPRQYIEQIQQTYQPPMGH